MRFKCANRILVYLLALPSRRGVAASLCPMWRAIPCPLEERAGTLPGFRGAAVGFRGYANLLAR